MPRWPRRALGRGRVVPRPPHVGAVRGARSADEGHPGHLRARRARARPPPPPTSPGPSPRPGTGWPWRAATCAGRRSTTCSARRVSPGFADVVLGDRTLAEAHHPGRRPHLRAPRRQQPRPTRRSCSAAAGPTRDLGAWPTRWTTWSSTPRRCSRSPTRSSSRGSPTPRSSSCAAGKTTRTQLQHALTALEQASAPIIGLVLNRALDGDRNAYGYSYNYEDQKKAAARSTTVAPDWGVPVTPGSPLD